MEGSTSTDTVTSVIAGIMYTAGLPVTLYYPTSGAGVVFPGGTTLLPGSGISIFSEWATLLPTYGTIFFGPGGTTSYWGTVNLDPTPLNIATAQPVTSTSSPFTTATSTSPTASVVSAKSSPSTSVTSTLSASNSKSTSLSPKSTISTGGAVGIGIGCAIAGAAIVCILFWFFKRNSRNRHHTQGSETGAFVPHQDKQPVVNVQPLDNANLTTRTIENNLPQPLEDNAIAEAISKISNSIKNHVQSYYHSARVSADAVNLDALQALGDGLPTSIGTLNTMLANPTTRETALRLCIAWIVVSRIQFGGDPRISFLPPEVTSCISSMTGLDSKPQGK